LIATLKISKGLTLIDALDIWLDEFEKLPNDPTGDMSPTDMANFINDRVTGKLDTSTSIVKWDPAPSFTWQKSIFEDTLRAISKVPSSDPIIPAIKIATGWQNAVLASKVLIQPQAKMNPPFPATNGIAATAVSIIDPASVALGFAYLVIQLSGVVPVPTRKGAVFPRAIREAFLMLTVTISGIDTQVPPVGPIPYTYPMTKIQ
jgi:hypothetical protein